MSRLEDALDHCLEQLSRGRVTVEECLAGYPEHAATLRPMLHAAERLKQGQQVRPSPAFRSRTRTQVIAHAAANPPRPSLWQRLDAFPLFRLPLFGPALKVAFSLLLVLLFVGVSSGAVAQAAEPADPLYNWRLASEEVLHAIVPHARLDTFIAERRADDLVAVRDDADLTESVLTGYQRALGWLTVYQESSAAAVVADSVERQYNTLQENDIPIPPELATLRRDFNPAMAAQPVDLDRLLHQKQVADRTLTVNAAITTTGHSVPLTSTVTSSLAPADAFDSLDSTTCQATATAGTYTCVVEQITTGLPQPLLAASVKPCFAGTITHTLKLGDSGDDSDSTPIITATQRSVVTHTFALPAPAPPTLAYVQSNDRTHDLMLLAPTAPAATLHQHAAAPAWSPDGATLAFFGEAGISDLGGVYAQGNGVWLLENGSQGPAIRQLVAQDHVRNIAWSPNGQMLAFEVGEPGRANNEVIIVAADSGQAVNRFSGEHPAWWPDNQHLVVKGCYDDCGLWRVTLDGARVEQLTFTDSDSYPAISRNGDYLAFSSRRDGDWEIYRLGLADGSLRRLTSRPGTDTTPRFLGVCGQEIYWRADEAGQWSIRAMNFDGTNARLIREGIGPSGDWGLARPAVR